MRVLIFPTNFVWNISHPKKNSARYYYKCTQAFIYSTVILVRVSQKISAGERPQAARLLRSWVQIPPGAWIFVCCECRVLSGRGLCDELITRPEESYRLCYLVVCDLETSRICAPYIYIYIYIYIYDIRSLRGNDLTIILLTWRKWCANNASK